MNFTHTISDKIVYGGRNLYCLLKRQKLSASSKVWLRNQFFWAEHFSQNFFYGVAFSLWGHRDMLRDTWDMGMVKFLALEFFWMDLGFRIFPGGIFPVFCGIFGLQNFFRSNSWLSIFFYFFIFFFFLAWILEFRIFSYVYHGFSEIFGLQNLALEFFLDVFSVLRFFQVELIFPRYFGIFGLQFFSGQILSSRFFFFFLMNFGF